MTGPVPAPGSPEPAVPALEAVASPALSPLWRAARSRLERNGLSLDGTPLVLRDLSGAEADAIAGLIGVPVPPAGTPLRVRMRLLDHRLQRSVVGCGLLAVLTAVGGDLSDQRAVRERERVAAERRCQRLFEHAALVAVPELVAWLERVLREGTHRRVARGDEMTAIGTLEAALDVLAAVRWPSDGRLLAVLAADIGGDAHLLDRGRPTSSLVISALAWRSGTPPPSTAAEWRSVWEAVGVVCDDLSCDVLVLNLPCWEPGAGPWRLTLRQAARWRDGFALEDGVRFDSGRRGVKGAAETAVFVCENPAVVAAVDAAMGDAAPTMVCLDGMPSTAAFAVLCAFGGRYEICYHGDFDWRGLAIADVLARRLECVTGWCYGTTDYRRAIGRGLGSVRLVGRPTISPFDAELAGAMDAAGLAIYEEQVIAELVEDLSASRRAAVPSPRATQAGWRGAGDLGVARA